MQKASFNEDKIAINAGAKKFAISQNVELYFCKNAKSVQKIFTKST